MWQADEPDRGSRVNELSLCARLCVRVPVRVRMCGCRAPQRDSPQKPSGHLLSPAAELTSAVQNSPIWSVGWLVTFAPEFRRVCS